MPSWLTRAGLSLNDAAFVSFTRDGAAAADTVYLNDGGHGTGNSADAPLGSLEDAFNALAHDGGKLIAAKHINHQRRRNGDAFTSLPVHTP